MTEQRATAPLFASQPLADRRHHIVIHDRGIEVTYIIVTIIISIIIISITINIIIIVIIIITILITTVKEWC